MWPLICLSVLRDVAFCMLKWTRGCDLLYADREWGCGLLYAADGFTLMHVLTALAVRVIWVGDRKLGRGC